MRTTVPALLLVPARNTWVAISLMFFRSSNPRTYVDEWERRLRRKRSVEIRNAVGVGDDEDEAHGTVDDDRSHNHTRDRLAGVSRLLGQMRRGVGTSEGACSRDTTDVASRADRSPATIVAECAEDLTGCRLRRKDPKRDDGCEPSDDVEDEDQPFQ